jgi:polysaccharide biosynthesis protein PslJ
MGSPHLPSQTAWSYRLHPARSALGLGLMAGMTAVAGGIVLAWGGPLAALAVVLALATVVIVLRDIEMGFWGVIGVIFLLPFAAVPLNIGLKPTFLDLALAAVAGVWFLGLVTGQQRTVITTPITIPLIIFILVAIFSFIFGLAYGPLTTTLLRRFAELILSLSFVLIVVDYGRDWRRIERLVKVILLAGGGAAFIGIFLWLLPPETTNSILNSLQRVGYPGGWVVRFIEENPALPERAIGTSVDPNALGGVLVMIGALAGPQLVAQRPLFPRWLTLLLVALIFICLVLTFSRGALVGLAAGLAFVAVARYRRLLPYLVVALLLLLLLPMTQGYVARFVEGIQGQDLATQMRYGEYRDAVTLILRYPLFGVGFAGSPDSDLYLGVANVYLAIGQRMGFLGLTAFAAMMAVLFGYAFFNRHSFRGQERLDPVWIGLHAALIGGLVVGIFDHYLFNVDFHHTVTIFWLFVGLAATATRAGSHMAEEAVARATIR